MGRAVMAPTFQHRSHIPGICFLVSGKVREKGSALCKLPVVLM